MNMTGKIKRELVQWVILIGIGGGLYLTGWHTEVIGGLQRVVLATGLIRPNLDSPATGSTAAYDLPISALANGAAVDFGQFKGKVVFLNFWATWCPPCVAEMPAIQALYDQLGSDQVQFVMVATNDETAKVKKFLARKGYTFPVYELNGPLPSCYQSSVVPTTFVIDRQGNIVARHQGMANYDSEEFRAFLRNLAK